MSAQSKQEEVRPVRYILFSHWAEGNKDRDIAQGSPKKPFAYLRQAKDDLSKLLDEPQGLLVLFFDPGWNLSLRKSPTTGEQERLAAAKSYADGFKYLVQGAFEDRVRVLTTTALQDYIQQLRERERPEIFRWFVGEKGAATYDSPKIVEAFLRVRLLGSGLPVFRVDWDVLVNIDEEKKTYQQLGITKEVIESSLERNDKEQMDIYTRTWVYSAGYQAPAEDEDTYESWSCGFATRIQPALKATPEMCQLVCGSQSGPLKKSGLLNENAKTPEPEADISEIVQDSFEVGLAMDYLGVSRTHDGTWKVKGGDNVANLGANPLHAVISGALLNLSASAIMDLPPFSNMTRGVMWIDDHLKFELHNSLGHLRAEARESCRLAEGVKKGRGVELSVVKGRSAPRSNLAAYTWCSYLPTLLRGIVMDAWIRRENEEASELPPLAEALNKAVTSGDFSHRTALKLERDLREVAIKRIDKVYKTWAGLRDHETETHTLASAWATSKVAELLGKTRVSRESPGFGLIRNGRTRIDAISDLRNPIQNELRELIWDAIDYIRLTLAWPGMIQTMRAVKTSLLPLREQQSS